MIVLIICQKLKLLEYEKIVKIYTIYGVIIDFFLSGVS